MIDLTKEQTTPKLSGLKQQTRFCGCLDWADLAGRLAHSGLAYTPGGQQAGWLRGCQLEQLSLF